MGAGVSNSDDRTQDERPELVRRQSWPVDGPAELELAVDVGRVAVRLTDGPTEVHVEVRHDPSAGTGFTQGLTGIINWLGGVEPATPEVTAADAVRGAEISWSGSGRRLVVRSSTELALRTVPLAVTVIAPEGSRMAVRTGSGEVVVDGRAGWTAVRTGSGDVRVTAVDGEADVTTGSGTLDLGPVTGRARLRTGSGGVRLAAAGGPTEIKAGSGEVAVGAVAADLGVRTGSGDIAVADARAGRIDLTSGSGGMRIGVHPGVAAELDLSSGSGRAHSDLEVGAVAPAGEPALRLRGRTGTGDVLVTRAVVPA
jgi:hypothetical protein